MKPGQRSHASLTVSPCCSQLLHVPRKLPQPTRSYGGQVEDLEDRLLQGSTPLLCPDVDDLPLDRFADGPRVVHQTSISIPAFEPRRVRRLIFNSPVDLFRVYRCQNTAARGTKRKREKSITIDHNRGAQNNEGQAHTVRRLRAWLCIERSVGALGLTQTTRSRQQVITKQIAARRAFSVTPKDGRGGLKRRTPTPTRRLLQERRATMDGPSVTLDSDSVALWARPPPPVQTNPTRLNPFLASLDLDCVRRFDRFRALRAVWDARVWTLVRLTL